MTSGTTVKEDDRAGADGELGPSPFLFLCLDSDNPMDGGRRYDLSNVRVVELGRDEEHCETRQARGPRPALRIGLPDPRMSRSHLCIERVMGQWVAKDLGSRNGTFVNGVKRDHAPLVDGDRIEIGRCFFCFRQCQVTPRRDGQPAPAQPGLKTLLPHLEAELQRIRKVAGSAIEVLIQGESGTGKELLARQIHAISSRPGDFVAVNCGAIPRALVESELFGHQRGAFAGALDDRSGLIRASHRGTLFLDEISDLPLPSQTAFLRTLENHEVVPLGATRPVKADFRLVAASYHDVRALAAEGGFRGDLFSRLAGYTIDLPPLRERKEDLGLLIGDLLTKNAPEQAASVRLHPDVARALLVYSWPHNIRELEKCLAVALTLSEGEIIGLDCLPEHIRAPTEALERKLDVSDVPRKLSARDLERREQIVVLLSKHGGNVSAVARDMGKGRTQIRRWILRYDIEPSEFR